VYGLRNRKSNQGPKSHREIKEEKGIILDKVRDGVGDKSVHFTVIQ
jgi:hypothetical protein